MNKLLMIILMTGLVSGIVPYNIICGILLVPIMLKMAEGRPLWKQS